MYDLNDPATVDLTAIQGLVIRGFGDLRHAAFVLLRIDDSVRAKLWLRELAPAITTAETRPEGRAVQIAFSHAGLRKLGCDRETLAGFAVELEEGIGAGHRARRLGDTGSSAPEGWAWGGPENEPVDVLLLLYAGSESALDELVKARVGQATREGLAEVGRLPTPKALFDGHGFREHFGFRDGVAQPKIRAANSVAWNADSGGLLRRDLHRHNTIEPGEVLLGYRNEYGKYPVSPGVAIDPTGGLPLKPYGRGRYDFGKNGSYLVLRQLEQDVEGFWRMLDDRAGGDPDERIRLAAKMVGRWPSGAPLVKTPDEDRPGFERDNDFGYAALDDVHGTKCPFGSHVRRSNPRDSILAKDTAEATKLSNRHRMIRRGRPYGEPVDEKFRLEALLDRKITGERGLHFVCLQSSISRQFEFVQQTWCNSAKFAGLYDDPDPLIGEQPEGGGKFTIQAEPVRRRLTGIERWVRTRGGGYFFLPSLPALAYLAAVRPLTSLQKHAAFFDTNHDGLVSVKESVAGFVRLGVSKPLSMLLGLITNLALTKATDGGDGLTVSVERIAHGKHAFDSGIFDEDGNFDETALDELFEFANGSEHPPEDDDAITRDEMNRFITHKGDRGRPYGDFAHWFSNRETELIFCLAADAAKEEGGKTVPAITRRMLREFAEGELFPKLARLRVYRRVGGFGLGKK